MNRKVLLTLFLVILSVVALTGSALADSELDGVRSAKDIYELEKALREVPALSDEVTKMDGLTSVEKNYVLTGVLPRTDQPETVSDLEVLVARFLDEAVIQMEFEPGYPYLESASANGAFAVVKTTESGYIYVVAFEADAKGGVNSAWDVIHYYNEDNGVYKSKQYVEAGVETKVYISCADTGSGRDYVAYTCCFKNASATEFQRLGYTVKYVPKPSKEEVMEYLWEIYISGSYRCPNHPFYWLTGYEYLFEAIANSKCTIEYEYVYFDVRHGRDRVFTGGSTTEYTEPDVGDLVEVAQRNVDLFDSAFVTFTATFSDGSQDEKCYFIDSWGNVHEPIGMTPQ